MISERLMFSGLKFADYVYKTRKAVEPSEIARKAAHVALAREDNYLRSEGGVLHGADRDQREQTQVLLAGLISKLSN